MNYSFGDAEIEIPGYDYGYGYSSPATTISESFSEVGLNIGLGGAYAFSDKLDGTAQLGYTVGDADQLSLTLVYV